MKIRQIYIHGFGCLKGMQLELDPERVNLVVANNEQGKTTLAAAIYAAFFGLPQGSLTPSQPTVGTYEPWRKGPYRVELIVEAGGRLLTIRRDFDRGEVRVVDELDREVTEEFRDESGAIHVGERLLGMSRHTFRKSAFIGQNDMRGLRRAAELTRKLKATADSEEGVVTVEEATELLEETLKAPFWLPAEQACDCGEYTRRLDEERVKLESAMQKVRRRKSQAEQKAREANALYTRELEKVAQRRRADYLGKKTAFNEANAQLQRDAEHRARFASLRDERDSLASFSAFPAQHWEPLRCSREEMRALDRQLAQLEEAFAREVLQPREELLEELRGYEDLRGFSTSEVEELSPLADRSRRLAGERDRLQEESAQEVARLEREGHPLERYDELHEVFVRVRGPEREFLSTYRASVQEQQDQIQRSQRGVQLAEDEVFSILTERNRFRLIIFTIMLVCGGVMFLIGQRAGSADTIRVVLPIFLGAMVVAFGLSWLLRRGARRENEERIELHQANREAAQQRIEVLERRLEELQESLDLPFREELVERFERFVLLEKETARARELREYTGANTRARQEVCQALRPYLQKAGLCGDESTGPQEVERLLARLRRRVELDQQLARLEELAREYREKKQARQEERLRLVGQVTGQLEDAGLTGFREPYEGIEQFEAGLQKHRRYRELEDKLIPEQAAKLLDSQTRERLEGRRAQLLESLRQLETDCSELATLAPEKSEGEYLEEFKRLSEDIESLREERIVVLHDVWEGMESYKRDWIESQGRLASLARERDRAVRFQAAVLLAIETLRSISREIYLKWSGELNGRARRILQSISPEYGSIQFHEDLSFTLEHRRRDRPLAQQEVDAQLSAGARDQIYLAVRLAMTSYFSSRSESIPVVLDDPLASSDDDRFAAAMDFLTSGLQRQHQIILLTCHRLRAEWWKQRDSGRVSCISELHLEQDSVSPASGRLES